MFEIQQTIIEEPIAKIKFVCDVSICKGACCTMPGGLGAPLLDGEIADIQQAFPVIKNMLPPEHLDAVERYGLYEGMPGSYTTMCYNNRACVFVIYEGGMARCSIEKAFIEGKLKWRKPISCHLFPIRVDRGITMRMRYERIPECNPALQLGEGEQIYLSNFLKDPLVRAFGASWYAEFQRSCENKRQDPV